MLSKTLFSSLLFPFLSPSIYFPYTYISIYRVLASFYIREGTVQKKRFTCHLIRVSGGVGVGQLEGMKESGGRKQGVPSPCAACKLLRRRCGVDCVFAPYFPADDPQKFANVHKVFGASNVNKMLQELPEHQRGDAVSSMVYEANARVRDPVYGCVGAISSLQQQIDILQTQLAMAQAEVVHLRLFQAQAISPTNSTGSPSSGAIMMMSSQTKPFFDMDMVVDQAMWSC